MKVLLGFISALIFLTTSSMAKHATSFGQSLPESASVFSTTAARALVGSYGASIIISERERFEKAIIKARGSCDEAAKILGVSRATFFRRAKDLGLVRGRVGETTESRA
jgi:transcriptional regulator of acetoin/glycerol metabolism